MGLQTLRSVRRAAAFWLAPLLLASCARVTPVFLSVGTDRVLLVEDADGSKPRPVASGVSSALHDPELNVVWFESDDHLSGLDLDQPERTPILVATGLIPLSMLQVERVIAGKPDLLERADGCIHDSFVLLTLVGAPKIETIAPVARPKPRLVSSPWLTSKTARQSGMKVQRRGFWSPLPDTLAVTNCEGEDCGASLPFGPRGWKLVVVSDEEGADCRTRSCLLFDAASAKWASPLEPRRWGPASAQEPGPCGPYRFNRRQDGFLIKDRICSLSGGCRAAAGQTLGWLAPGAVVGDPG